MSFKQTSYIADGFEWDTRNSFGKKEVGSVKETEPDKVENYRKRKSKRKLEDPVDEEQHLAVVKSFNSTSLNFLNLETLDECERLVLAYPNSSKAWILYMVFHLKQAEIDKARTVVKKSLKAINFREEQEKLNMWIAYLNIESLYGTEQSLKEVFKEALCYNDSKKIYNHMVEVLLKYNRFQEAEETLSAMIKKFKEDPNVWTKFMSVYIDTDKPELAQNLFDRSLSNLHKKHHADVMVRFARLHFEKGNIERCQAVFEKLIHSYPKRKDILSQYISILNKIGNVEEAKRLSECLKLR